MTTAQYPHVFNPIKVGTLQLDHRLVVPPHGGGGGNLVGSDAEFETYSALWVAKQVLIFSILRL